MDNKKIYAPFTRDEYENSFVDPTWFDGRPIPQWLKDLVKVGVVEMRFVEKEEDEIQVVTMKKSDLFKNWVFGDPIQIEIKGDKFIFNFEELIEETNSDYLYDYNTDTLFSEEDDSVCSFLGE